MQINKYVLKNIFLFFIILFTFGLFITFIMQQRPPFVSKIREGYGYTTSIRGKKRNVVRNIYKYGYYYASKLLRI